MPDPLTSFHLWQSRKENADVDNGAENPKLPPLDREQMPMTPPLERRPQSFGAGSATQCRLGSHKGTLGTGSLRSLCVRTGGQAEKEAVRDTS